MDGKANTLGEQNKLGGNNMDDQKEIQKVLKSEFGVVSRAIHDAYDKGNLEVIPALVNASLSLKNQFDVQDFTKNL